MAELLLEKKEASGGGAENGDSTQDLSFGSRSNFQGPGRLTHRKHEINQSRNFIARRATWARRPRTVPRFQEAFE